MTALGSLSIAFTHSLELLLAGRAVQGLGSTASWVAALALVSDLARPGRKGEAIGYALAANSFGAIAGPAIGGIAGGEIAFEAPFLAVTAVASAMFVAGWAILPRLESKAASTSSASVSAVLLRPAVIAPGVAVVAGASFLGMIDFTLPLDLDRRLGTAATTIGLIFALAAALDLIAPIAAGQATGAGAGRSSSPARPSSPSPACCWR